MSETKFISYPRKCLVDQVFGRLTVVQFAGRDGRSKAKWKCKCDCGGEIVVDGSMLKCGKTTSCGCYAREILFNRNSTHGMTGTRTHRIWMGMRQRCENEHSPAWKWYGAKGITVCERWHDFKAFLNDMGQCPSDKHSIDRIDGTKGYEPGNCRWATSRQQSRNTTANRLVNFHGSQLCLADVADLRECEVQYKTLAYRVRASVPVEVAVKSERLFPRHNARSRLLSYKGEIITLAELARHPDCVVNRKTLWSRLRLGWELERAVKEKVNHGA